MILGWEAAFEVLVRSLTEGGILERLREVLALMLLELLATREKMISCGIRDCIVEGRHWVAD